jgi:hypothetical protein
VIANAADFAPGDNLDEIYHDVLEDGELLNHRWNKDLLTECSV